MQWPLESRRRPGWARDGTNCGSLFVLLALTRRVCLRQWRTLGPVYPFRQTLLSSVPTPSEGDGSSFAHLSGSGGPPVKILLDVAVVDDYRQGYSIKQAPHRIPQSLVVTVLASGITRPVVSLALFDGATGKEAFGGSVHYPARSPRRETSGAGYSWPPTVACDCG